MCVCVCLLDITINSAKTDDQDVIGSGDLSGPCVRWGLDPPEGRGNLGESAPYNADYHQNSLTTCYNQCINCNFPLYLNCQLLHMCLVLDMLSNCICICQIRLCNHPLTVKIRMDSTVEMDEFKICTSPRCTGLHNYINIQTHNCRW